MFSDVPASTKGDLCECLDIHQTNQTEMYLGLPTVIGRNKSALLEYVKDKMWKKIRRWNNMVLSHTDKEVLIKNVAQAIPFYVMSVFLLPRSLYGDIDKMLNAYWWGRNQ